MKIENIAQLLEKYRSGQYSSTEETALKAWLHQYKMEGDLGLSDQDFLDADKNMLAAIELARFGSVRRVRLWPRMTAIAASVILIAGLSFYFLVSQNDPKTDQVAKFSNDIIPGSNKAVLTLGNGQKISLTDAGNGTLATENNTFISKTADGQIVYNSTDKNVSAVVYNTITTPRGGQYNLTLSDGTKVFLNAASSLKYPAQFTGKNRSVQLSGEGYFEVSKDKIRPFVVTTDKQEVEVLGTHFNISSYPDEKSVKTTLLEGLVRVSPLSVLAGSRQDAGTGIIIKPNQQAILSSGERINVVKVDAEEFVAWKNGEFEFNDEPLESIMRKISRWYDVEVEYKDADVRKKQFAGNMTRYANVSDVLHMLELTGYAHFKIEGRRIIVTK